jgi:integrase
MATIRKKGEYQWHAQIRRKGYPFETKTFNTKTEAEAWARSVENEMDRGVFASRAEAEGTTLYEALGRYEREISCKKKGFIQERYKIRVWQTHALAKRSLASLKGADFAKYRDERLASGSSASTVRLALALISHLYTIATKEWDIPVQNPVKNIRLPRENNSRERRLLDGEETTLLSCLEAPAGDRSNPWVKPLVILALETAMRQGELLSLEWKNIDLQRQVARLPDTKNGTARDVPLSRRAVSTLEQLVHSTNDSVFITTASALKQSWKRATKRASMDDLHFHDLRHEATSRLAEKLALHELMKVTGHKDTRMLARYYHPRAEDLAQKLG